VRKWALTVVLGLLVLVAFVVGSEVRERMALSSLEGFAELREWVQGFGWAGVAAFVGLVTFRGFLLLSSHVVLILGGLVFGALGGTLWGALGLIASALMQFLAARLLGDDWVRPRIGDRYASLQDRIHRLGPAPVWVLTAHPAGPQTPVNLTAGLVGLPIWGFALAVALGAPLRAGAYSVLGTGILSWGLATSLAVGVGFVVLMLLPLAFPTVRSWVLGTEEAAQVRATR
jgi:uncharacterized membrane protein YdjX (TVP38/TMEM64 family)